MQDNDNGGDDDDDVRLEVVPRSITNAKNWLKVFNEKFDKKFNDGNVQFSRDRKKYWRMIVKGIDKVKDSPVDVVTRLICLVGIGKHANCGMLPPRASKNMYKSLGINVIGCNDNNEDSDKDDIDDSKIPLEISKAIQELPSDVHTQVAVRKGLIDEAYFVLRQNNHHIKSWVHDELDYWIKDFEVLAAELASKLHLTQEEYNEQKKADEQKEIDRQLSYEQGALNILQNFQQHGFPNTMEEVGNIMKNQS